METTPEARARAMAEQALKAQAAGQDDAADRLFAQAQGIDPDAVAVVLAEHDAAHEPDARDQATFDSDRVAQQADPSNGPNGGG